MDTLLPHFIVATATIFSYLITPITYAYPFKISLEQIERKLPESEVKKRGIDVNVTDIVNDIDEIDIRKMARSSIFETSYGFRWKMYNVQTGKVLLFKVNKKFKLISVRKGKKI